jgi:hypothetical protein
MPHGACLLAACLIVCAAQALAQTSLPDPLTPSPTDPRNPSRFQKFKRAQPQRLSPPANFKPVSGAGVTGFDATNNPARATAAPTQGNSSGNASSAEAQQEQKYLSPYQEPPPGSENVYAAAPASPPVELGPIRQPPKKRKAHTEPDDPYAPLGLRAGSFTLLPAIEMIAGHDSNPGHVAGGSGATLYTVAPELQVQSNWARHELKADLRGSYTGYSPDSTPTLSRPFFDGKVNGRVDVTHDTRIDLNARTLVSTDNPGSPNLPADVAKLPIFATFGGSAGIAHQFSRFELGIKADAERTAYQDSKLTNGTTASNKDRDFDQYTGTLRGSYELLPGVKPFVELSMDTREHDLNADFSGYQRDSKGTTGIVGTTFELSRILTGEIGVGYTKRAYEDPRLANIGGIIGDASLIWTASALTAVKFIGKSTVGESTVPGVSGTLSRDVGVQIDHSFRRWLVGSLKLGFGVDDYVGLDREDTRYSAGVGLTYKLNRTMQLKGEFRQDWLHSNVAGNDYTSSVFLLGLRFQK